MKKVLIAVDNGPLADQTASFGFELANRLGAEPALLSVIEPGSVYDPEAGVALDHWVAERRNEVHASLVRLAEKFKNSECWKFIEIGDSKKEILKIAEQWKPDLLVLGSQGRTGTIRAILGSVAEHVARRSQVPVVIVPQSYSERKPT